MKKRLFVFTLLVFSLISVSQIFSQTTGFYLGTFHFPNIPTYHDTSYLARYSQLRYNSMIGYIAHTDTDRTCSPLVWGGFFDVINSNYFGGLTNMKNKFGDYFGPNNFMLLLEREKILRPAYGQSSKYQAEYIPSELQNYRPAYGYTFVKGNVIYDSANITSRKCIYGIDTAGYLLKGLYENLEQVNFYTTDERRNDYNLQYNMSDRKSHAHSWYIKPRMRIDPVFAAANLETPVVSIVTKNYSGLTVDSTVITCRNFGIKLFDSLYYNGNYVEHFYKGSLINELFFINVKSDTLTKGISNFTGEGHYLDSCKVDYQVYWHGAADVYIDYVKVEDEWAHDLMTDSDLLPADKDFKAKINAELKLFKDNQYTSTVPYFYLDEYNYNNLPCIAFVNSLIKNELPNSELVVLTNDYLTRSRIGSGLKKEPNYADKYNYLFTSAAVKDFFMTEIYPFDDIIPLPASVPSLPNKGTFPGTVGYHTQSNNVYNDSLHYYLERGFNYPAVNGNNGPVPSFMDRFRKCAYTLKNNNIKNLGIAVPFHTEEIEYGVRMRESTVEEMKLMCYLSLAYGANAIYEFSFGSKVMDSAKKLYSWGTDSIQNWTGGCNYVSYPKTQNYYGQPKYESILKLDSGLRKIGDFIYDKTKGKLIYDDTRTINTKFGSTNDGSQWGLPFKYIQDIKSIPYDQPVQYYNEEYLDPTEKRYWEFGFFNPRQTETNDKSQYLLAVNKRCAPTNPSFGITDIRRLKIKFDKNQLTGFNNWVIKDAINDSTISVFDKNSDSYITAGEFLPGEGKLIKLAPVMQEGGTLATDETISNNINCEEVIYSNNKNITISPGVTVTFSENASIEMDGGNFTCGTYNTENPVTLIGKNESNVWNGLVLSNCTSIGIYNTNISKITSDTAKAVLISNCNNINISNTSFNMGTNAGAIQAVFTTNSEVPVTFNVISCNFDMGTSSYSAISILSNASSTLPVVIDWCNFTSNNENANAITLSGVTGGAIKNSNFSNFMSTINTLSSAIDLYGNTIIGRSNSTGVLCVDGSSISLSPSSGLYLGGNNYIRNYGGSSSNISSDNSLFNIHNGRNNFDLNEIEGSKHLTGTFSGQQQLSVYAMRNCFHKDSITNIDAAHSVIWNGSSNPVNFVFTDYSCELTPPGDYFVYQYGGYNDTVYYRSGGEGGGINPNKTVNTINIEDISYKSLKDTININLRKRNYATVEDKAKLLLTQFPDSLESIGMVQKLYISSLNLDSTKIGITKTFLENLISANTQNPTLIKRAFYFIQKCKVKLKQYQSALDGFQYIMTQNPYTYEGLVASWDYAATYLLMGTGGSYKGDFEQTTEELNTPADTLISRMTKSDININKSKNKNSNKTSTEQITKTFYEKVKNVTKDDKTSQEAKVKTLEKTIETTKNKTEKNDAVTELAKMKQIKEVVKIKKPTTVNVHITLMNDDIKKVFGIGKKSTKETTNNIIPTSYNLYQNYPNPFNPTTKIAYDIPRDAKVKLVIYDILGREMKTLVNNEFRSVGKYITEFNGSNLASGIYFARILVNEGKDFMAVKKMVLVK